MCWSDSNGPGGIGRDVPMGTTTVVGVKMDHGPASHSSVNARFNKISFHNIINIFYPRFSLTSHVILQVDDIHVTVECIAGHSPITFYNATTI